MRLLFQTKRTYIPLVLTWLFHLILAINLVIGGTAILCTSANRNSLISNTEMHVPQGDGGPATDAILRRPRGVTVDKSGNLFFLDDSLHIRRVEAKTSIITTVAGSGDYGFKGDGGPATKASFSSPSELAVDDQNNLFIVDSENIRIRRIDAKTGIISTIAGDGSYDFSGDGSLAVNASLNLDSVSGLAIDRANHLFVADTRNSRIRCIDLNKGIITTVAGNGNPGFSGDGKLATQARLSAPSRVTVDGYGNLFILDSLYIRRVDSKTQIITTVAGTGKYGESGDGGLARHATFSAGDIAADKSGNLFIVGHNRIRRIDVSTQIINTIAGNGEQGFSGDGKLASKASLFLPESITVDIAGNLYIADTHSHRIRWIDVQTGIIQTLAGRSEPVGDNGPATNAILDNPTSLTIDQSGNLFILDTNHHRVRRVDAKTKMISTVSGNGTDGSSGIGGIATDASICMVFQLARGDLLLGSIGLDWSGNLYVASAFGYVLQIDAHTSLISSVVGNVDARGDSSNQLGDGGPATQANLELLWGGPGAGNSVCGSITVDRVGNIFIAEAGRSRIRRVDARTRIITTVAGNGVEGFSGDGHPASLANLLYPAGVAVDHNGNLFIADTGNNRIRKVDALTGIISTIGGDGKLGTGVDGRPAVLTSLTMPTSIAVNESGNVFFVENQLVRKIDAKTRRITTIAGKGKIDRDGIQAINARLDYPSSVTVDQQGNLYISTSNNRVRRVDGKTGVITTVAGK